MAGNKAWIIRGGDVPYMIQMKILSARAAEVVPVYAVPEPGPTGAHGLGRAATSSELAFQPPA
jgi:hypothetical protein